VLSFLARPTRSSCETPRLSGGFDRNAGCADDDVEKVVRSKSSISPRFDVIAGYEKLLLAIRRREDASVRIIGTIGEKLQSQKRMSGAAFSQVNLDCVRLPFSILGAHHHKIQGETTDNALFRQTSPHLCSFVCNERKLCRPGKRSRDSFGRSAHPEAGHVLIT